MADYSYMNRGFMPQEKNTYGTRIEPWDTRNNRIETQSNGWGKTGFSTYDETPRDHVCRPVIVDAQGNKRPLVAYGPNNHKDNCVTKTETMIEQTYAPQVTRYGNFSPTKMEDRKDYGGFNNGWNRPRSPSYERPPVVDQFISQVQTEASRPSKTSTLLSSIHWRKTPHSNGHDGGSYGYNGSHHGNSVHQPPVNAYKEEPTIITEGGWERPSRAGWAAPSTPITKPTNDIGTAIDYLKETAFSQYETTAPTQRRFTIPPVMVPKVETYSQTIDSRDALRRYGGGLGTPQPIKTTDTYSSTIDSREALRKYHGQMM